MIAELFYRGHYADVLQRTCDDASSRLTPEGMPYVVGSLAYVGRLDEAAAFFQRHEAALVGDALLEARYYLGVAHCRALQHGQARHLFGANLRDWRRDGGDRAAFFAQHGLGFYRFIYGRLGPALRAANAAETAAVACGFFFGRILAADLKGHALAQLGKPQAALRQLRVARQLATVLERASIVEAVDYALTAYSAVYGLDPHGDVQALTDLLASMRHEDTYSRSLILLELARQESLRGRATVARGHLDAASAIIFSYDNKRHEVMLNLAYAHLHHLAGKNHQAMSLVRACRRLITPEVDHTLEQKLVGLELQLALALGLADNGKGARSRLDALTRKTGRQVGSRILARLDGRQSDAIPGEDPLGDLMDLAQQKPAGGAVEIIASGFLLLLHELTRIAYGEKVILLDILPGAIDIFDQGDVVHVPNGASKIVRMILAELATGEKTKEELARRIWEVDYHPLKHDSKVYGAVSKLRQMLGPRGSWIVVVDGGYALDPEVKVRLWREPPRPRAEPSPDLEPALTFAPGAPGAELNLRQAKMLDYLSHKGAALDVKTSATLFATSTVTASRDLCDLEKRQLVARFGKGRATRYTAPIDPPKKGETHDAIR